MEKWGSQNRDILNHKNDKSKKNLALYLKGTYTGHQTLINIELKFFTLSFRARHNCVFFSFINNLYNTYKYLIFEKYYQITIRYNGVYVFYGNLNLFF